MTVMEKKSSVRRISTKIDLDWGSLAASVGRLYGRGAGCGKGMLCVGIVIPLEDKSADRLIEPLTTLVAGDMAKVNQTIVSRTGSEVTMIPEVANHLIASGGKRMRPILTLATAGLCGYSGEGHVDFAAAVEFMHTATLLHDDVVDESDLRRGKAAARVLWGNEASVLVGDFLLGQAFKMMVGVRLASLLEVLSGAAVVIAEGEVMQLSAAKDTETTEDAYLAVIRAKTAALFAAACEVGPDSRRPVQGGDRRLRGLRRRSRYRLSAHRRRARLWRLVGQARQECRGRFPRGKDHPAGGAVVPSRGHARARILAPDIGKRRGRRRRSRVCARDNEEASRARRHHRARPALWRHGPRRPRIVRRFPVETCVARRGRVYHRPGALRSKLSGGERLYSGQR